MTPHLEVFETVGQGIDDARTKIVATRQALLAVLDDQGGPESVRQSVARLERMEAELVRIEAPIAVREGLGGN